MTLAGLPSSAASAQTISLATNSQTDNVIVAEASDAKVNPEKPEPVMVTVEKGDSLSKIAKAHETTWVRIYYANESIKHPDVINPGDQLRIPANDEQLTERELPNPPAPAPTPTPVAQKKPTTAKRTTTPKTAKKAAPAVNYPVSPNEAKAFIYQKESGNNPHATNPTGCYGIGQDCNGVLRDMCGADYACQDQYFTNYAIKRYGSWEAAYAFWLKNRWW